MVLHTFEKSSTYMCAFYYVQIKSWYNSVKKTHKRFHYTWLECLKLKSTIVSSAGEDVEQWKLSYIVDRSAEWFNCFRKLSGVSSPTKYRPTLCLPITLLEHNQEEHFPRSTKCYVRKFHSFIHNMQKNMGRTQMSIN